MAQIKVPDFQCQPLRNTFMKTCPSHIYK